MSYSELIETVKGWYYVICERIYPIKTFGSWNVSNWKILRRNKVEKKKWLLFSFNNPNKNNIQFHLENLSKGLALYSSNYENLIILGDFNLSIGNNYMAGFCDTYDLRSLITEPACYKNPENPTCIDLIFEWLQ